MITRKKKLRLIQFSLLIIGVTIIFITYLQKENISLKKIVSTETEKKIKKQIENQSSTGDVFYKIKYSGLDMTGNRYILKSEEAYNDSSNQELVNMKVVEAIFYFKDGTILNIWSDNGVYNNKSLDMDFSGNVKALYENSELYAQKAMFSNSESFLTITENVKVIDYRGTVFADKLFFDIKKQELNVASSNNKKVNTNINLK